MTLGRAAIAGVVLGAAYTWSPLTLIFLLGMAPLCRWGVRGLGERERRWVLTALVAAIASRLAALAVLLVATDPAREQFRVFFPDAKFATERSWWILNSWRHVPMGPDQYRGVFDNYGASSFHTILALVQFVVGIAPYGVNLVSVACFIAGALLLFRFARRVYGPSPAGAGLLLLLFWPTLFAWSLSTLREGPQLLLIAVVLVSMAAVLREARWGDRALALLCGAGGLAVFATLRPDAFLVLVLALALGLFVRLATLRSWIAGLTLAVVLATGVALTRDAGVRDQVAEQVHLAAARHIGHVETPGGSFRLLDTRFYAEGARSVDRISFDEGARFLLRSVTAFFVVPLPWQADSISGLTILPQQCAWYVLLAFAIVGFATAARRDTLVTATLAALVFAAMLIITPNSGNTGTLVRHRDMIVPAMIWLAAVGLYPAAKVWA